MHREEMIRRYIYSTEGDQERVLAMQEHMLEMVETDYHEKCQACRICEESFQPVIGAGNVNAKIVIIGRNPGEDEDKPSTGIPFIGRGGQLLDRWIEWVGFDRSMLYLTNSVKCFTTVPDKNRPPKADEIKACTEKWLQPELALLSPVLLITVGKEACTLMTGMELKNVRGKLQTYGPEAGKLAGVHVIGITHMGAALRNGNAFSQFRTDADYVRVHCRNLGLLPSGRGELQLPSEKLAQGN